MTPANIMRTRDRRRFLGGSDVPKVLGVSPYENGTPVRCWLEKTGVVLAEQPDPARDRVRQRGKRLEPYVRGMVVDKLRELGHDVRVVATNRRYRDDAHAFLAAEVDFDLELDGRLATGEIKTATGHLRHQWGEEGTDEIPVWYTAQTMHGLGVTGREVCVVGALVGLDDVRLYFVHRDAQLLEDMRARLVEFWTRHVVPKVHPDPIRFPDVAAVYPKDAGYVVEATAEVADLVRRLAGAQRKAKQAELEADACKLQIGAYMRDAAALTVEGKKAVTFVTTEQRRLNIAAIRRQHADLAALFDETSTLRSLRVAEQFK